MRWTLTLMLGTVALTLVGCPNRQLPMQAIILSNDDGFSKAPITLAQIDTWVDAANETYTNHGFELTFDHGDVTHVKSTRLNNVPVVPDNWQPDPANGIYFNDQDFYDMFANSVATGYPDKIVVLFRNFGGGGWSWGPPSLRYVSMPSYTHTAIDKPAPNSPNDTLLAHEVGHYMGLAHTFADVACNAVTLSNADGDRNGQRSNTTEDDVADTPADPNANCAPTASLNCAGGSVVVNSTTFNPPWTNIMSYHDCLPEIISLDQRRAMNFTLSHPMRSSIGK